MFNMESSSRIAPSQEFLLKKDEQIILRICPYIPEEGRVVLCLYTEGNYSERDLLEFTGVLQGSAYLELKKKDNKKE